MCVLELTCIVFMFIICKQMPVLMKCALIHLICKIHISSAFHSHCIIILIISKWNHSKCTNVYNFSCVVGKCFMVERLLMVQWVVGLILHGGPLTYFFFQPVLHDWCNKGCGMYYPVGGMVHIQDALLLIRKSSPCSGSSGFPLLLYEGTLIMPYNCK